MKISFNDLNTFLSHDAYGIIYPVLTSHHFLCSGVKAITEVEGHLMAPPHQWKCAVGPQTGQGW